MRRAIASLLCCALLLLSGCWDRLSLEDTAHVITLGIDWEGEECLWTFALPRLSSEPGEGVRGGGGDGGGATNQPVLIAVRGCSLIQAVQIAQASLGRVISLHQMRYILFGEELARRGLAPIISALMRHNEVRRGCGVSVVVGRAVDAMSAFHPPLEANPVKVQEGLLLVQKHMHLTPPIRLQHFHAGLLSTSKDPIMSLQAVNPSATEPPGSELPPMGHKSLRAGEFPRAGGNPVEFAGTAIFRGDRLVGLLNVDETNALLALRGEMGKVYATVPDPADPAYSVAIRYGQENKPQFRIRFENGRPVAHVRLQIEGEILAVSGETNYVQPENRRVLERFIERYGQEKIYQPMLEKVYHEWGADPVGFGHLFRARFPTIDAWTNYGWFDQVDALRVSVETTIMIRRFGLELQHTQPARGR